MRVNEREREREEGKNEREREERTIERKQARDKNHVLKVVCVRRKLLKQAFEPIVRTACNFRKVYPLPHAGQQYCKLFCRSLNKYECTKLWRHFDALFTALI